MTDSRWELTTVLVVSSASLWSVWHFVLQLFFRSRAKVAFRLREECIHVPIAAIIRSPL